MHFLILFLMLLVPISSFSRVVVNVIDKEVVEEIIYSEVAEKFNPKYYHLNENEGGSLAFDVTEDVNGNEVREAHIILYSGDHKITDYSFSLTSVTYKTGSTSKYIVIPINTSVVSNIIVKLYCVGDVNYVFKYPIVQLQ